MHRTRPAWVRALTLYRRGAGAGDLGPWHGALEPALDSRWRAWSRFRRLDDPDCFALYSVRAQPDPRPPLPAVDDHTLVVVREFRRVPMEASGLGLVLFSARPGHAAEVIAALAHWVERAVSLYQPTYLLLAHSLEQPRVSALLAGVHEIQALQGGRPASFSVDRALEEIGPLMEAPPDRYIYCPDGVRARARAVAPDAV